MKFSNPRSIALFTSGIVTLTTLLIYGVSSFIMYEKPNYPTLFIFTAVLMPLTYFVLYKLLNTYIWNKIKVIYKNIHSLKAPKKPDVLNTKKNILNEKDIIEKVNEQVMEWHSDRTKEIDQLKQMEKYRREFIGNVSHELKTPIFNIQGYILTLLDGGLEDASINREYLSRTEKSIDRMINIIHDLDAISKLESGELKMNFKKFDIIELVNEVFDFLEVKAKEHNIRLYVSRNTDKIVNVVADWDSIRQVLVNLVDNSIKYGKNGGRTKVSCFDMDEHILIEVSDNGMGVDKEDLNRIFERFYRTPKARSVQHGGSGLGLSIVKHIIEAHNQTINVRSTIGLGTTFAFTLKKS